MMRVSLADAKRRFAELVDRAAQGEYIAIITDSKPIAMLVPFEEDETVDVAQAARQLQSIREEVSLDDVTIRELRDEGRRR